MPQETSMLAVGNPFYRQFIEVINECVSYRSSTSVEKALGWAKETTDCSGLVYCEIASSNLAGFKNFVNCSYSEGWVREYFGQEFHRIDPVISKAQRCRGLHAWPAQSGEIPKDQRDFLEAAQDYGLTEGLVCSAIRCGEVDTTTSICSMATNRNKQTQIARFILQNIIPALQLAAEDARDADLKEKSPLSRREAEVLRWVAAGKTAWEAGAVLAISEATVKFHLNNIYRKLNITTRAQAISHSIQMGWL
jgi:DNA-binding CsgD family transcriptional regulator